MRILNTILGAAAIAALAFTIPAAAQTREVIVGTPGFMNNGGLDIITKAFEAETGIKVTVKSGGMDDVKKLATDGAADAVFLPADEMDQVKGAIKAGTRKRVGRSYQGLAVVKGQKIPDISTKEKFIATLKSANKVLHSRCSGTPGGPGCTKTSYMLSSLFETVSAVSRIAEVFDTDITISDPPQPKMLPAGGPLTVRLEGVGLRRPDAARPVLAGVDLAIEAGETMALAGATGSGKTALVDLIGRLVDPTTGRVATETLGPSSPCA